jgi:hypothetical protein
MYVVWDIYRNEKKKHVMRQKFVGESVAGLNTEPSRLQRRTAIWRLRRGEINMTSQHAHIYAYMHVDAGENLPLAEMVVEVKC